MAVPEQTPYKEYIGNGVTTIFPLGFDCNKQDHLIINLDEKEATVGSWLLDTDKDTVNFNKPPSAGVLIKIRRDTPLARSTDYKSYNNSFKPEPVNQDMDNIWLKMQELGVLNWLSNNNIKDLNEYVDSLNEETRNAFLEDIRKQGISLQQLDKYVDGLYQQLANTAVEKGWLASFIADKNGMNQQQINDLLPTYADKSQSLQQAISNATDGDSIMLSGKSYSGGSNVDKKNLNGIGYKTLIDVQENGYGIKSLQTQPNWDKMRLSGMSFKGASQVNTVGFLFDPNDAVAGRRNLEYVTFEELDIAISKPTGNIGNTYTNINAHHCNYVIKAKSVWLPQEMHSGNDTWRDFQIDNVHVWAFDYTDLTGGGAVHIKDGIIEYCDGGGIRFEYSDRYPPFIAPRISNVWFEQVAKASKVTRDGVDEIPRAIKLVNTAMCIIENCKLDNIELVNSTALALNCRVDSINMVLDSSSNLIVENAFINGSVPKNITIKSIAKQSYPVHYGANLTLRGTDIVGVQRMPQGASRGIGITFTGSIGKNWALDGTSIVYATSQLDDNGSECAYLNLDKTKVNVFPSITTPANHWVVWGISVKAVGDVTGTFEFNYDYKLGNIILEKDKWVHSFGIVKAPTAAMRIRAKFTPTSDMALKLKNYFIVSFEKESDAIAFANSRMSIDTYPKSMQVEYDPPPLAAGATTFKNLDCLGISPVDNILCSFSNPLNGVNLWTEVSNDNVITVFMKNPTTNVIDLASGILSVKIL